MVRLISGLAYLALLSNAIDATSLPDSDNALNILEAHAGIAPRSADIVAPENALERRKGGGGRGGGSSGGGSSGGRGGGGRTGGSSNVGGSTRSGSGSSRSYGGGGYYAGGAAVPYTAGQKSSKNGLIAAPLLVGAGALAIMPGLWLYGAYPYYYNNPYRFYNRSANATENNNNNNNVRGLITRQQQQMGANQTLPVVCLCQEYSVCGCEENDDQKYLNDLVGNGSYAALNKSIVTVSEVNNTRTLVLNGTLENGTTAPGGEDDAGASLSVSGYWVMCLIVLYGVML